MSIKLHALERSIRAMAHGGVAALERRRAMLGYDALSEIENQFQVAIDGSANQVMAWTVFKLAFDVEFYYAPEQRDSPLTMPQLSHGVVVKGESSQEANNPLGNVTVSVNLTDWLTAEDDEDTIQGAKIAIGVCSLSADIVEFSGYVHLSFQGYGSPTENVPDLDIGT